MVAGEGVASAAAVGGTADHVCVRPVVLDEVHVHGGKVPEGVAEVPAEGDRLEEYLGQQDRRAEVDIHTALEFRHERAELLKIPARRLAGRLCIK